MSRFSKLVQKRARALRDLRQADFGTIAGYHTVQELKDLLAAKLYAIDQVNGKMVEIATAWKLKDPLGASQWATEWAAFLARWQTAKELADSDAKTGLGLNILSDDMTPTGDKGWNAILGAWEVTPGRWQRGDFADLSMRLDDAAKSISAKTIDFSATPQPKADSDFDANLYKKADTAEKSLAKTVDDAEKRIDADVAKLVVAGKQSATAFSDALFPGAKFIFENPKTSLALGVGGLLLVSTLYIKIVKAV